MGKASQEAYERGFMAGAQHERLHRDIESWRCKCHDVPYKKAPPLGEYASKAVAHVETDPKEWVKWAAEFSETGKFPKPRSWAEVVRKSYADVQNYRIGGGETEPPVIQSFGKGTMFEPVAKTNEQIDAELNAELEALRVGEPPEGGKLVTLDQLEEVAAGLLHDGDGDYGWLDSVYDGTSEYARALCELIVQVELDSFGRGEGTGDNARRVAKRLQARLVAEHSTRRAV